MNYKNYLKAVRQGYEDPTLFNGNNYTCNECGELLEITEICECLQEGEKKQKYKIKITDKSFNFIIKLKNIKK
jgi:hypothetical protein